MTRRETALPFNWRTLVNWRTLASGNTFRSLISKLVLLLLIFITVPVILYKEFRAADEETRILLLESLREQGRLVAEGLRPTLEKQDLSSLPTLSADLERFVAPHTGIKILYRPAGELGTDSFFFVASKPAVAPSELEAERERLAKRGVFDNIARSCRGELPMALRHRAESGRLLLLTSISAINTDSGCWAVITTHGSSEYLGRDLGEPYWKTLEVKIAAGIYLVMAAFTIIIFATIWRSLMSFRRLARNIRTGQGDKRGFAEQNQVPELAVVASEFDRMTGALQESAESIRLTAEDNAHAFKTPIAIMRQSLEPLRRLIPPETTRGKRALDVLEVSLDRLDNLVASARQLDETTAELLDPPRERVDLTRLVGRMLIAYRDSFASRGLKLDARLTPSLCTLGEDELLETVFENLIDNALEVSPRGSTITVELRAIEGRAEITLLDQGPGVPSGELERIFERYVSSRAPGGVGGSALAASNGEPIGPHMGIGLWIVRRNVQAIGGAVRAENRPDGGLAVMVRLPLAA